MNEWFSVEFSRNLGWFSLLSLLSLMNFYVHRGRHRTLVVSIWRAMLALGIVCLGASVVGLAGHFLRAADTDGVAGVIELAETITDELRIAMFSSGAVDLGVLATMPLHTEF